jgi:hypothetical protein
MSLKTKKKKKIFNHIIKNYKFFINDQLYNFIKIYKNIILINTLNKFNKKIYKIYKKIISIINI